MVNVNLISLAEKYYGSKHYLFLILSANGIDLPASFAGGETIKLPPRASGSRLQIANRLRKMATSIPV